MNCYPANGWVKLNQFHGARDSGSDAIRDNAGRGGLRAAKRDLPGAAVVVLGGGEAWHVAEYIHFGESRPSPGSVRRIGGLEQPARVNLAVCILVGCLKTFELIGIRSKHGARGIAIAGGFNQAICLDENRKESQCRHCENRRSHRDFKDGEPFVAAQPACSIAETWGHWRSIRGTLCIPYCAAVKKRRKPRQKTLAL